MAALRAAGCVFAEDEADILVGAGGSLEDLVRRRADGIPLEHLVGWAEFAGLRITVDPGVFVPRRRTEWLVREAAALARARYHRPVIVDLCCGTGAIAAALTAALGDLEVYAADADPRAVACARKNLPHASVSAGDLFDALPVDLRGRIDILAANVPYVPSGKIGLMPPEARDHEALMALDGGGDGLDIARRVSVGAVTWLAPGGHVLVEASERQADLAVAMFTADGLTARFTQDDEIGATVIIATRPT